MSQSGTVVITGASGGIGRATALTIAARGYGLVLVDLSTEALDPVEAEVLAHHPDAAITVVASDVTDPAARTALATVVSELGEPLAGLVNNAGVISGLPIDETTEDTWDRLMDVNAKATFFLIQALLPQLRAGRGSIVNVSSVGGLVGFPSMPAYIASKTACVGLTRALAVDLVNDGIRVNAVCPATIDTPMPRAYLATVPEADRADAEAAFFGRNLMKRFGTPEEVASAIDYLISPAASFITGLAMPIDGGVTAW